MDIKLLNEQNEDDEYNDLQIVRDAEIRGFNRPVKSNFLQHLIESNSDDFVDRSDSFDQINVPVVDASTSTSAGRFSKYVHPNRVDVPVAEESSETENMEMEEGGGEADEAEIQRILDMIETFVSTPNPDIPDEFCNSLHANYNAIVDRVDLNCLGIIFHLIEEKIK